jgi:hypothetical protein
VKLAQADFCAEIPFAGPFDLVIDRASLTHNPTLGIQQSLEMIEERLAPGGIFVGVHWFSKDSDDFTRGIPSEYPDVRKGYKDGPFAEVGLVHFFDRDKIESLFSNFTIEVLDHVVSESYTPKPERLAWWNIVAKKK